MGLNLVKQMLEKIEIIQRFNFKNLNKHYECFIIGGCNFNNFNTSNEDFYERIINGGYI